MRSLQATIMTDPFLILHKVRGEPAFDVAIRMDCPKCMSVQTAMGDIISYDCEECDNAGFWWIIPTSGHRAYPYDHWKLPTTEHNEVVFFALGHQTFEARPMPSPWPDHYPTRSAAEPKVNLTSVVAALSGPVERRF